MAAPSGALPAEMALTGCFVYAAHTEGRVTWRDWPSRWPVDCNVLVFTIEFMLAFPVFAEGVNVMSELHVPVVVSDGFTPFSGYGLVMHEYSRMYACLSSAPLPEKMLEVSLSFVAHVLFPSLTWAR